MHPTSHDIGAYLKVARSISPKSVAASTEAGAGVDRTGFNSCTLVGVTGASTGTPTTRSAIFKLQDSADNSTFADFGTAGAAITAADGSVEVSVNLQGARKYIRAACVVAFTGGTAPETLIGAAIVLGGADKNPAA